MPFYAKLVKGQTYDVRGRKFILNKEQEIDEKTYSYLKSNPLFEVMERDIEGSQSGGSDDKYTKSSMKKLNKEQQEAIIKDLKGNPEDANNEEERVALILELQEG